MTDNRLELLKNAVAEDSEPYGAVRINKINIRNYRFFAEPFPLDFSGENVLLFGENGSGKSSIYRAMELLTGKRIKTLGEERNIFCDNGGPEISFTFNNGTELVIDTDTDALPEAFSFVKGLSVFTPMLDYKKLLSVHYSSSHSSTSINLYEMFRQLLRDYPISDALVLSQIKEPAKYFDALKGIINAELLDEVNALIRHFSTDFKISQFYFEQKFAEDGRSVEPVVRMNIDFMENPIESYHTFLNEARLSALAISLYFAAIKRLLGTLSADCLKILVLDDLLISLDMSNRHKLLPLLQREFRDFQIFFFTHDRDLFELYRAKLKWKCFELYLDDSADIPAAIVKKGQSCLERAKEFYAKKEYDCCGFLLRKELEKVLKAYLPPKEQRDKNCNELDLSGLIAKAKAMACGDSKEILAKLDIDRKHILNPLTHDDHRATYSEEIRSALTDVEVLRNKLK
jgi:energy-coupling factor transporter ATP-binding protein EcfA2